jgi:hypothetical protein
MAMSGVCWLMLYFPEQSCPYVLNMVPRVVYQRFITIALIMAGDHQIWLPLVPD